MISPLSSIPADLVAACDYERYSAKILPADILAHLEGGAADEITLRRNREAFDKILLNARVLARVSGGHTRVNLFGRELAHPFLLAPVGHQRLFHPEGEIASARAAAAFDGAMVVSTLASVSVEEIAAAAPGGVRWFQLYFRRDRDFTLSLVRRAEAAGCGALVVTVDALFTGVRHRARRAGFAGVADTACAHLRDEPKAPPVELGPDSSPVFDGIMPFAPTWTDLAWLRANTRLPILLKGVMSPDDVPAAFDAGMDGIIVSNHGGRSLDGVPATLEALPRIAEAVGGRIPLLLDGGVTRGTDALTALALGATAVLVGRAYIHALAAAGPLGVAHTIRMLREELEAAMAQTGCRTLADIGPQVIFRP